MTTQEMDLGYDPPTLPLQGPPRITPVVDTKIVAQHPTRHSQSQTEPLPQRDSVTTSSSVPRPQPACKSATAGRPASNTRSTPHRNPSILVAKRSRGHNMSSQKVDPLLPVNERKSQEEKGDPFVRRPRKDSSDSERRDITPDGGSGGREGRQFTVAKVGNNGRIYLRPSVRPANQRVPQPHFVFPTTPPQTAGLAAPATDQERYHDAFDISRLHGSDSTSTRFPSSLTAQPLPSHRLESRKASIAGSHQRALSDSTIYEPSIIRESDHGAFKIVVTQPAEEHRPKTLEDLDIRNNPTLLEISIPSWKLGTPRFSTRGTPFIRRSSCAPTEEFRSSDFSLIPQPGRFSPRFASSGASRRPPSLIIPPARPSGSQMSGSPDRDLSPRYALRATRMFSPVVIDPVMFDALTFKPACDDRSIVRYSPSTGAVTAATPSRLVAEITSPCFLDYELLSDFFLTFRAFLAPMDLLKMLYVRMRWALVRTDEVGMVVRVRTFVALRHWILNYFVDDFVCEYEMRTTFCNLLNNLTQDVSQDVKERRVQLKILAELKKCWRRVCAQFWDGPEFDATLAPEVPITPGGIPGHRDPNLDPGFWQQYLDDGPPQLDSVLASLTSNRPDVETSFLRDVVGAGGADLWSPTEPRPEMPKYETDEGHAAGETQISPTSISSAEVVSCSFPTRVWKSSGPPASSHHQLATHPVHPNSISKPLPVASTPRALVGKRVRPHQSPNRNDSSSDSLRDHNTTLEQLLQKNTETLLALPYAGSLVRGNVMAPSQAFVEMVSPTPTNGASRHTTIFQPDPGHSMRKKAIASGMSGQGMRKLIGSVRRALSTRGQEVSPTQGKLNIAPIGPRGVTANRLPGTPIVPQAVPTLRRSQPTVRVDVLGAQIVEEFKKAIREDAAEAADGPDFHGSLPSTPATLKPCGDDFSQLQIDSCPEAADDGSLRSFYVEASTTASEIVNDAVRVASESPPLMAGALPASNPSFEAFAEAFMLHEANPTPPSTPPDRTADTPRRSSYVLGQQHMLRPFKSADSFPPPVPDLDSPWGGWSHQRPPPNDMFRLSLDTRRSCSSSDLSRQSIIRPPLSALHGHRRCRSSKSLRSDSTMGPIRYSSFHSGTVGHSTVRSFDATTCSDGATLHRRSGIPTPQPLRILRRRPGGDLRGVEQACDLDHHLLRKSRSVGSLTTYTDSLRTSFLDSPGRARNSTILVDVVNSDYSRGRADAFSIGVITGKPTRPVSLLSTYSSRPIMRPSFEIEARKLANIPDDDDDGGIESTLLKLEGKYQKRRRSFRLSIEPTKAPTKAPTDGRQWRDVRRTSPQPEDDSGFKCEKKKHGNEHIGQEGVTSPQPPPPLTADSPNVSELSFLHVPVKGRPRVEVRSFLSDGSVESYSSIPLLERGLTDDGRTSRAEWTDRSVLQDSVGDRASVDGRDDGDERRSYEVVTKSESIEKIKAGDTMPSPGDDSHTSASSQSFLNMDSDDDELSSELSDNATDAGEVLEVFPSLRNGNSMTKADEVAGTQRLSSQQTKAARVNVGGGSESWPVSTAQALAMSLETDREMMDSPRKLNSGPSNKKALPPTSQGFTAFGQAGVDAKPKPDLTVVDDPRRSLASAAEEETRQKKYSAHLPFILAFDSEVLAQQFTLIEKDALNEIDWKELIYMKWTNADKNDSRSWVQFLRDTDARGVDVVLARFNMVVKWAISEIVLTQDMEERARCIIKFIHIAAHCSCLRNFATASQIAVALTSSDVGRLSKTWEMVPGRDMRTLRELAAFISPTSNFVALRSEMEGGGVRNADTGCIPYVGIYTHDLIFNAQRPSEIASSPTTALLVNFERCRIAASLVKTLLRLVEASAAYTFQPIEGITERCLWMSALSDDEIRRHSARLE